MEKVRRGLSQSEIARQCGVGRKTVRRWTQANGLPERKTVLRYSRVEAHRVYLEQRWRQGCHNAALLARELQTRGFTGSLRAVRYWLRKRYGPKRKRTQQLMPRPVQPHISPRRTAWQILKQPDKAKPFLDELYRRSPEIAALSATAREFFRIVRDRDQTAWSAWRNQAATTSLSSFAKHLCQDQPAFLAALKQPWSNGPVEGHIHRLKLIKRSMYGRAGFDLLRLRVLNAA